MNAFEVQRKMWRVDPETMSEVSAYNNMCLEYDLPRRKNLEKRYKSLVRRCGR